MVIHLGGNCHPAGQDHTPPLLIDHQQIRKYGSDNTGVQIGHVYSARMMHQAVEAHAANSDEQSQDQSRNYQAPIEKGA
jgi:hypothetical protein